MNAREPQESTSTELIKVVAGILRRDGRILICQRAAGGRQGLKWEFPGGKVEAGESEQAALARELEEELGLRVAPGEVGALVARLQHDYGAFAVELAFYEVPDAGGEPENRVFAAIVWETAERLPEYDFLEADRPVLKLVV